MTLADLDALIRDARTAKLQLQSDGHVLYASAVQRLVISRISSRTLNKVLHADLARTRALLRRAQDAMSRREPDGISTAAWNQLLQDIEKEIG